jgi:hypothetical protein
MNALVALIACTAVTTADLSEPGFIASLEQEDCMVVKVVPRKQCEAIVKAFAGASSGAVLIPALDPEKPVARFACEAVPKP